MIKLITDTCSDIDNETAQKANIDIIPFEIFVDGKTYFDRVDFTTDEFYEILETAKELPKTGMIKSEVFMEKFKKAYDEGYSDLIYVGIPAKGSGTVQNALRTKEEFFEENPDLKGKFGIHIVDGKNYSGCYGHIVLQAAEKIKKGETAQDIVDFCVETAKCTKVYFVTYSLKFLRKSGRLNAAAAFAGELLGLKPVISIVDAVSGVEAKVKGEKNLIPKLLEIAKANMIPQTPYSLLITNNPAHAKELETTAQKMFGEPASYHFKVGSTIACHAGSDIVGIVIRSEPWE